METTRRKLVTLLSSIPALGFLGVWTKSEATSQIDLDVRWTESYRWTDRTDEYLAKSPLKYPIYYLPVEKSNRSVIPVTDGDLIALRYDKKKGRWILIGSVVGEEVEGGYNE